MAVKGELARVLRKQMEKYGSMWTNIQPVRLGNSAGTVLTGTTGVLWARQINGKVIRVLNALHVPAVFDLHVLVGRSRTNPKRWQIIEQLEDYLEPAASGMIAYHHAQHEYPGPDTVFVRGAQFLPFTVLPDSDFAVLIYGGVATVGGARYVVPNQSMDVSAYVPSSGALWLLFEVNASGVVDVIASAEFTSKELLDVTDIPLPVEGGWDFCAVRLYAGQEALQRNLDVDDFIDLRWGRESGGTEAPQTLDGLQDVDTTGVQDGQGIEWDAYAELWVPVDLVRYLNDLLDVVTDGVTDGQLLGYDAYSDSWIPVDPGSGGGVNPDWFERDSGQSDYIHNKPNIAFVDLATTSLPNTPTYNNGSSGVGATLTASSNGDIGSSLNDAYGSPLVVGKRILYRNFIDTTYTGIYEITQAGSAGSPYILTRTTDFDEPSDFMNLLVLQVGAVGGSSNTQIPIFHAVIGTGDLPVVIGTSDIFFPEFVGVISEHTHSSSSGGDNLTPAKLALTGDISPSQITSDQNDYNPTGLSGASVLRLSTDASRNITGLQSGSDGRIVIIHNIGSNSIVLNDESASSSAANRFALSSDITLAADDALTLQYDSTSNRWRCIGKSPGEAGGGGDLVKIDGATLGSDASNIDITSIPGTYSILKLYLKLRSDRSAIADPALITVNNDTGSNYYGMTANIKHNGNLTTTENIAGTSLYARGPVGDTAPSDSFGVIIMEIPFYADSVHKIFRFYGAGHENTTTTNQVQRDGMTIWKSTSAINRITITPENGTVWKAGSSWALYGLT